MKKILLFTICMSFLILAGQKSLAMNNTGYSAPCYTIGGQKYCNGNGGGYFFYEDNFYMCLNRVNNQGYILDQVYAQYNPQTKKLGKILTSNSNINDLFMRGLLEIASVSAFARGEIISVNAPAKSVAQYKAEKEKEQALLEAQKKKQAEEAAIAEQKRIAEEAAAKERAIQEIKEKHQKALTAALESGTLPSCKKLYWKYLFLYQYTPTNPEPFKNIEGTELTYCKMKDNSTAMLQFKDTVDSQTGAKYRGVSLMDFTGKTKYYPWN